MPGLSVVTPPNNVQAGPLPVVAAPQNVPQAPLPVQNAPTAPQPASLPVKSAPSAPQPQTLPVQSAPANQQESLAVQLPPIVLAIQTAINRGADPATILSAIGQQNPSMQPTIDKATSMGAQPAQILQEILQQNSGISNPDTPPDHVGFVQSLVQSIARPFLRPAVGLYDAGAGIVAGLKTTNGDFSQATAEASKTRDLGYFGKVAPTTLKAPGQGAVKSFLDTAGTGAEIAANFVGGEGAVGAGEDLIKGSLGTAVKTGIKQGAKAGALAGLGSGLQDPNPSIKGVVEKTVEGGIGGGITGGILTGVPALAIKSFTTVADTVAPDAVTALTKAIKPGKTNTGFDAALKMSLPVIEDTSQTMRKPISNINDLADVIKLSKDRIWATYQKILGPNSNATIDGNQIADAMVNSVDKRTQIQNPGLVDSLSARADTYRKPLSLADAEDFLQSANNDLHSYYAKNKVGQKVAAADPQIAPTLAEAGALRDALYSKLNDLSGADAAALKKQYGALSNIQNEVIGRANVAARQNPDSLATQINTGQAIGDIAQSVADLKLGSAVKGAAKLAASHYIQNKNSTDGLIQSAFSRIGKGQR